MSACINLGTMHLISTNKGLQAEVDLRLQVSPSLTPLQSSQTSMKKAKLDINDLEFAWVLPHRAMQMNLQIRCDSEPLSEPEHQALERALARAEAGEDM